MAAPYSYQWACDIVDDFIENHARATDVIEKHLGRDRPSQRTILVHFLRFSPKRWNTAKRWYKKLDRIDVTDTWLSTLSPKQLLVYIRGVVFPDLSPHEWAVVRVFRAIDVDIVDDPT